MRFEEKIEDAKFIQALERTFGQIFRLKCARLTGFIDEKCISLQYVSREVPLHLFRAIKSVFRALPGGNVKIKNLLASL